LAACAAQTSKIQLWTRITSVFVRTVPTIAMAAATVDAISGGRFVLGIGSSHRVQVEPEHGVPYSKPLTRSREAVAIIRALLRDGRVNYAGETVCIERFDLWFTPLRPVIPIYISAVFPKMMTLCGEIADGIILTRSTLATAAQVREQLAEGAKRAGAIRKKYWSRRCCRPPSAPPARRPSTRCGQGSPFTRVSFRAIIA